MLQFFLGRQPAQEITPGQAIFRMRVRIPLVEGGALALNPGRLGIRFGVSTLTVEGGAKALNPGRLQMNIGTTSPTLVRTGLAVGTPLKFTAIRIKPKYAINKTSINPKYELEIQ